ncbi:MAG: VanZ family protein [Gammaproteobacteria bacterium]|nr:VanZ family protein [Gammaproteobacteria bacterium]
MTQVSTWRDLAALRWWLLLGSLLIGTIIFLSLTSQPLNTDAIEFGDKWGHLLAYGVLMSWFGLLTWRQVQWRFALGFVVLGVTLEFIQGLTGYRQFDPLDVAANMLGVMLGYGLCATRFRDLLLGLERRLLVGG